MKLTLNKKGFTLIEVLLVVGIIAVLASLVLVSLSGAKPKANNTRRIEDIKIIQNALELYYAKNDRYPDSLADVGRVPTVDPLGDAYTYYPIGPAGSVSHYVVYIDLQEHLLAEDKTYSGMTTADVSDLGGTLTCGGIRYCAGL